MLFGAVFLLNPSISQGPTWSFQGVVHLLHNHSFLHLMEKAFHCAYFGLLFVDSMLGTKMYWWTALPLLILLLMSFKHLGD